MSEKQIRVLIADNQRLMRDGLRIILEDAEDIDVIGEAENGLIATQLAENQHPDVILMDIRMPLLDGIEATERICQQPGQPQIVYSAFLYERDLLALSTSSAGEPSNSLIYTSLFAHQSKAAKATYRVLLPT